VPVGGEFALDGTYPNYLTWPSIARSPNGNLMGAWWGQTSPGTDKRGSSIQGRLVAADGTPLSGEFQVNSYTTGVQNNPAVAALADGSYVIAWDSLGSPGNDQSLESVQAQRFASDASPQGAQFQVNTSTSGRQSNPRVAALSDGGFLVIWGGGPGPAIYAQRYAADGSTLGAQFRISTLVAAGNPSVAVAPNGELVVVWLGLAAPSVTGVVARRLAPDGTPMSPDFRVDDYPGDALQPASVAVSSGGDVTVAWASRGSPGTDQDVQSIQARRFQADGTPAGPQFQVNSYTTGIQERPTLIPAAGDSFVVVWDSQGSFGDDDEFLSIQGQVFAGGGMPQGPQFQVNSYTFGEQSMAAGVPTPGGFLVAWMTTNSDDPVDDLWRIHAQRYLLPQVVPALGPAGAIACALLLAASGWLLGRRLRSC
jgi:hypothetical protein